VRYACHSSTNTYNVVSFPATGNTDFASTARLNAACCTTLLNNITSAIAAVSSITNSSTVVASRSLGWDSGIVCNRQGLTATLHFTGYKMETDPGGGVGHGNGTGSGLYPRATYSCYQSAPPVPQNGACGNNNPGSCGSGNNCDVGVMTGCICIGGGNCTDGMTYNCSGVNGGRATSCREFWCLTADTLITMEDGTKKPIGELVEGDKVVGQTRVNTIVVARHFTTYDYVYGINGSTPFVTGGHPFMTKKGWRAINPDKTPESVKNQINPGKLAIGDEILLENGTYMKVKTITPSESPTGTTVYNPGLDGDNTYYANGMLVHNK
jgi:hypothetical protein